MRAITPVKPTTADMATLIDELFGRVSRALKEGESGSEVFPLKLRLLTTDFDRVDTGESYTKLHNFGVRTGTPVGDFSGAFRVLVSDVMGIERVRAPGLDVGLEVVRISVNEQFLNLMDPKPYASLDAMLKAFSDLTHDKTPAVNGET